MCVVWLSFFTLIAYNLTCNLFSNGHDPVTAMLLHANIHFTSNPSVYDGITVFFFSRYNVTLCNCTIGDLCVIHNGVCIGQDGKPSNYKLESFVAVNETYIFHLIIFYSGYELNVLFNNFYLCMENGSLLCVLPTFP